MGRCLALANRGGSLVKAPPPRPRPRVATTAPERLHRNREIGGTRARVLKLSILPRWLSNQWFTDSLVAHDNSYFLQCRSRGAKISPLFSTYPLLNTPVAAPRPSHGYFKSLPILTRIYPSVDAGVPPRFPQWAGNARRATGGIRVEPAGKKSLDVRRDRRDE